MSVQIDRVKLISEMARKHLTVGELAKMSGVSNATITAARSGKSCYHATAYKLAVGLDVKLEDILEREV